MAYYNDEIKQKFLESVSSREVRFKTASALFSALTPYETKLNKDVCAFDKQELDNALGMAFPVRTKSMRAYIGILRDYSKWCIYRNVDGAGEVVYDIDPDDIGLTKIRQQMISNPKHLQRYLNCIFQPESFRTVQNTYRARFWLAFAGIEEEEAILVRASEVRFDLMTIEHDGKSYPIYREALKCLHNCVELNSFAYIHPLYDKQIERPRSSGDALLRGTGSNGTNMKTMQTNISREIRMHDWSKESPDINIKLSYDKTKLSGIFYRTYEAERAGIDVDFYAVVDEDMAGKQYTYKTATHTSIRNQLERNYESDYSRWKKAFNI